MKYRIILGLLCLLAAPVWAQEEEAATPGVKLKELEVNSSPGYVLLGVQPTNIQRPSTPRDFAAGLQTAMVNGKLQPNFAMEFNPFNWFDKKSKKNSNDFFANDYFSDKIIPAIKKNFAVSLATSESDTVIFGNLKGGTGLGYGFRVTILPGTVRKDSRRRFDDWAINDSREQMLNLLIRRTDEDNGFTYENLTRAFDATIVSINAREDFYDEVKARITLALTQLKVELSQAEQGKETIKTLEAQKEEYTRVKRAALDSINATTVPFAREGFVLELAYSGVTVFQENQWDGAVYAKTGLWLTPSYRFNLNPSGQKDLVQSLDAMGILRYLWNYKEVDKGDYLDFGAKLQFNRNDWGVSAEAVARHASERAEGVSSNWTYSWLSTVSYTINEMVTLKFTFGSRFDGNTRTYTQPSEMVALGGLTFGFLK
jgi:hypothetical protein